MRHHHCRWKNKKKCFGIFYKYFIKNHFIPILFYELKKYYLANFMTIFREFMEKIQRYVFFRALIVHEDFLMATRAWCVQPSYVPRG